MGGAGQCRPIRLPFALLSSLPPFLRVEKISTLCSQGKRLVRGLRGCRYAVRVPRTTSSVLTILLILHSLRHTQRLIRHSLRVVEILGGKPELEVRSRDFEHAIFVWRGGRTETEREARKCHPNQHGAYVRQVGNTCTRKKCCNLECCRYIRGSALSTRDASYFFGDGGCYASTATPLSITQETRQLV